MDISGQQLTCLLAELHLLHPPKPSLVKLGGWAGVTIARIRMAILISDIGGPGRQSLLGLSTNSRMR